MMARSHTEVERERRLILAVIGATGDEGLTARAIQEHLVIDMATVRNQLRVLEREGLIGRREKKQRINGKWWMLWVRTVPGESPS